MIRDRWEHNAGGSGAVEEKPRSTNQPEISPADKTNTILDELTGGSSGFNNPVPYPFRKKRKRKNRKL
jgi:hypothetical protein